MATVTGILKTSKYTIANVDEGFKLILFHCVVGVEEQSAFYTAINENRRPSIMIKLYDGQRKAIP